MALSLSLLRGHPHSPIFLPAGSCLPPLPFTGPGSPGGSSPPRRQWWRPWLDHATGTTPTQLPWPSGQAVVCWVASPFLSCCSRLGQAELAGADPQPVHRLSGLTPSHAVVRGYASILQSPSQQAVHFSNSGSQKSESSQPLSFPGPAPSVFLLSSLVSSHCAGLCPVHVLLSLSLPLPASSHCGCPSGGEWHVGLGPWSHRMLREPQLGSTARPVTGPTQTLYLRVL